MTYSNDPKGEAAHYGPDAVSIPDSGIGYTTTVLVADEPPSPLAQARKAVAGGIASMVTGASAAVGIAIAGDGIISGQEWAVVAFAALAGFLAGAAVVYRVPNASR